MATLTRGNWLTALLRIKPKARKTRAITAFNARAFREGNGVAPPLLREVYFSYKDPSRLTAR